MTCTASDLINIQPLALSDTFNTWFDRTNEVIGSLNYLNIYDIGQSGGINIDSGCSAAYYNGLAFISVDAGAGIGIGSAAFGGNTDKVVIDAKNLEDLGTGASSNPATNDYIIVADVSDGRQGIAGTPKRTNAARMLPPVVTFGDSGNGSFTIQGDVNIVGNLNVASTLSYIDSNDLRIEDKVIELALNRYSEFVVSGSGFTAASFVGGQTTYYIDSGTPSSGNATTIGTVRNWSSGSSTTGSIQIHSFTVGGISDFVKGGKLIVTGAAVTSALTVTSSPASDTDYYNDELLTPAGFDIKGLSGDKTFLWNYRTPDSSETWNAFMANTNLGVTGAGNSVISSRFSSYGYNTATDNTFTFEGQGSSYSKFNIGTELSMQHSPAGAAGVTFGIVAIGSTGTTYPNSTVYGWVKRFNADQLDGAHASTAATAWTIPVSLTDGRVHEDFIRADGVRKVFSVANSGFAVGDVVRINSSGGLTFAKANGVASAEVFGMVETVHGSRISVVSEGYITGLTGARINAITPLVTGNVYYLSAAVAGGLIANPDEGSYALSLGEVRRAVLLATDGNRGYVTAYAGTVLGGSTPTDMVYLPTVAPVGAIQPFMGNHDRIPDGWLLCDGKALRPNDYPDLFDVLDQKYYASATIGADLHSVVIDGDTRNLAVNDGLVIILPSGSFVATYITEIDTATRVVTIAEPLAGGIVGEALKVYGTYGGGEGSTIFFLPDMRTRTILGTSYGDGLSGSGVIEPQLELGNMGGDAYMPEHQHSLAVTVSTGNGKYGSLSNQTGNLVTQVSNLPPYITAHWIIRSRKTLPAIIITGHNHDNFYIRYDIPHTVGAGAANTLDTTDREQFRSNAMALSKESDDSTSGSLGIEGELQVTGSANIGQDLNVTYTSRFGSTMTLTGTNGYITILNNLITPQKEWDEYGIRSNSPQVDFYNGSIRVVSEVPTIVLFSPTGGFNDPYENKGRIVHFGSQHPPTSSIPQEALITGSLGFSTRGNGATDEYSQAIGAGQQEFRVGLNISGRGINYVYGEDTGFILTRRDTAYRGQGSIRYRMPFGITGSTGSEPIKSVTINTSTGELKSSPATPVFEVLAPGSSTLVLLGYQVAGGDIKSTSGWVQVDVPNNLVPNDARGLIVYYNMQSQGQVDPNGTNLYVSTTGTETVPTYSIVIGSLRTGNDDPAGSGGQAFIPMDTRGSIRRFYYRFGGVGNINFYSLNDSALKVGGLTIRVVGYY